ncbi:MAG: ParB/RepB/Spo0J family partition protein [Actinobacteria bacterium]|nr:ParB/RepB/Spo0J family partition protein [Actinomycetota bacterium]
MNRKALGRGLSALLGEETQKQKSEDFFEIGLDLIKPNSEQPRSRFTEANLEELTQSIKANGVVQPILVRKRDSGYEIVAGERRWRAAQRAGLKKIPAVIKDVSDEKLLELALIENIQRQELNAMEEARAYKKLISKVGLTQEMVANRVGKDRTFIANYLRLLKLPDDIQNLVSEEKLSVGHARALLMVDGLEAQRRLARNVMEMMLSVRETEKAVKRLSRGEIETTSKSKIKPKIDANLKAAETKLRRRFGTQIKIIPDGRGTGGRIEMEYYSDADLDRIYKLLTKE